MRDANAAGLLRAIAEDDDISAGLVFADWLEERGETARAEFVRVQCELSCGKLTAEKRQALREQERSLLDAHRRRWIESFSLPIDDVRFDRGLIAAMRLCQWDGGELLDADYASRLVTLTELDLSGLRVGDVGLRKFAENAQFPALRKLMLSGNGITNDAIPALAAAAGMPRLDTLYLFGNALAPGAYYGGAGAEALLNRAEHFLLADLDLGEAKEGYEFTPGEADLARRQFVRQHLLPVFAEYFGKYERLQSATLCVAQFWDDEANDAVHGVLVVSELPMPILEGVRRWQDKPPDVNLPNTRIADQRGEHGSVINFDIPWEENSDAIPLWAAFCLEGGSQHHEYLHEGHLPAVLFHRHGGYEILPMTRPHLDGISPEWQG